MDDLRSAPDQAGDLIERGSDTPGAVMHCVMQAPGAGARPTRFPT